MHRLLFLLCATTILANSAQVESYSPAYNPRPQDFPNEQLYHAYIVIQQFKNTISCDPRNITATWVGHNICGKKSFRGFYCTAPLGQAQNLTVTSIDFNGFGLCAPELQGFIDQLPDLALFQATSNNFHGQIPRLSRLSYMFNLEVKSNFETSNIDLPGLSGISHCSAIYFNKVTLKYMCVGYNPNVVQKAVQIPGATDAKALLLSNN